MAWISSKLEFLYSDALGEIQDLVSRLETVHSGIPGAAAEAGDKINAATVELRGTLDELSQRWSTSHRFSIGQLLLSAIGGAAVVFALVAALALFSTSRGYWIANSENRKIVDAITQARIDISALSMADLQARLSYSTEDGRALVELGLVADNATEISPREVFGAIAGWLRSLRADHRRDALKGLLRAIAIADSSPAKAAVIEAVDGMLDQDALALASSTSDIRVMVHLFANLPTETRRRLVAGNFFCASEHKKR